MKILVVCQHYKPEPFNVSETCEGLVARGHHVTVLTGLPNYPEGVIPPDYLHGAHRDELIDGVRVVRVPLVARGKDLCGVNKIRRIANYISFPLSSWATRACQDERYDAILCFQFSPILMALPALRIARKQSIPCLIWCFDLWPEDMITGGFVKGSTSFELVKRLSRQIYSSADLVAVTSPRFADYFSDDLGLEGVGKVWLPQYAEPMFEALGEMPQMQRNGSRVVITFAGNVGGNQSVETVVKAASLFGDSGSIEIRIAGSGSKLEECRRLSNELGVRNVVFLGRRPLEEMPALYRESDALLLTLAPADNGSLVPLYTIPRKLQSYLAAGKPVLVAADGAVANLVERERCGLTCPAGDVEGLAAAMKTFASMAPEKRFEMAGRSLRLYRERFSRKRFFDDLESILIGLAARRRTA